MHELEQPQDGFDLRVSVLSSHSKILWVWLLAVILSLTGSASAVAKYILDTDVIPAGDLAGSTYGAPMIAAGAVTSLKIADAAITTSKFDTDATAPKAATLVMPDVLGLNFTTATPAYNLSPTVAVFPITVTCPGDRVVSRSKPPKPARGI